MDIQINQTDLSVVSSNILSLRNDFDHPQPYLSSLKERYDIIFLCEIWIKANEVDLFFLPGYDVHHNCCDENRAGGVLMFVNQDIRDTNVVKYNLSGMQAISVDIKVDCLKVTICGMFRSPGSNCYSFISQFEELAINQAHQNLFIIGDLNIDSLIVD